jgi:hypothetical protein
MLSDDQITRAEAATVDDVARQRGFVMRGGEHIGPCLRPRDEIERLLHDAAVEVMAKALRDAP